MPDEQWINYTATAVLTGIGTVVTAMFAYRLKARKQDLSDFSTILADLRGRINKLEGMMDLLQREHTECKATAAKLQAELDALKSVQGRGPGRRAKGMR